MAENIRGTGEFKLSTKSIFDPATPDDGRRILVNRLWPKEISKEQASLAAWHPDWAPSWQLREWYGFKPERWQEFCERYRAELAQRGKLAELHALRTEAQEQPITLVDTNRDTRFSVAQALRDIIQRI